MEKDTSIKKVVNSSMKKPLKYQLLAKKKYCAFCGEALKGNANKKFCNDSCRSSFNNERYRETNQELARINRQLKKNRTIILGLLKSADKLVLGKDVLSTKGFDFGFHTHMYPTRKGDQYFYCYDTGYLLLKENTVLIVRSKTVNT